MKTISEGAGSPAQSISGARMRMLLRRLGRTFVRVVVMFVIFFPLLAAYTNVFRPRVPVETTPAALGLPFRDVTIPTADGLALSGWLIPASTAEPKAAILVCHGVGANRVDVLPRAAFLVPAGYSCLLFDFRAQGESEGRRVSLGLHEWKDVRAALDALAAEYPDLPLGVFAQSMGAASAILAGRHCPEVQAYVLDSSFATLWEMARENFRAVPDLIGIPLQYAVSFWGSLLVGGSILDVSPEAAIQHLAPRPALFIHGRSDRLIPYEHSVRLHSRHSGPKELWLVPDAGHVASHALQGKEYERRVLAHYDRHLGSHATGQ